MGAIPAVGRRRSALVTLVLAALLPAVRASAQEPDETPATSGPAGTPNPFADFETHYLSNGVKVWFKHLAGAPQVSVSAGIPVGSDADPPGKEQLAHFTEHMLFSDHDGRTEQEIKDAVEGLGGRRNGVTYRDHTWYYVTIDREHGLFAIEWVAGILSPHEMDPAVVDRGRQPVENEIGARRRELFDHVLTLLDPAWLATPDFWEREFGIERLRDPRPYMWRSLQSITPEDLRGFYERHYAPGAITVTIVGDLDRDQALERAEKTFGSFPARPADIWRISAEDPGTGSNAYNWSFLPTARYQSRHKLFDPSAEDLLTALFVRDLLSRRLNQRLRYGERKAVYGASASLLTRGPAAYLQVSSRIDRDDYDFAEGIIDEEIEFLRAGSLDPAEFETDRAAVVERLRGLNQDAESLNFWTRNTFYDPGRFADFPDVLSFYQNVTQEEVAAFAGGTFDNSRRVLTVTRPQPFSQGTMVIAVLALVGLTLKGFARVFGKPVEMKKIRYIAHFRLPIVLRAVYTLGVTAVALLLITLSGPTLTWATSTLIEPVDNYLFQSVGNAVIFVFLLTVFTLVLTSSPRKLLVFEDHVRIKTRAWRSRVLKAEDIAEISMRRFRAVWLTPQLLRGPPLAFGLMRPGIHLRPAKGRSYFFRARDTDELAEVLVSWWEDATDPAPGPDEDE